MARLKCPNCGSIFDRKALLKHGSVGATRASIGVGYSIIMWPFVLRVHAQCPNCKQTGWLKVLKPWSRS